MRHTSGYRPPRRRSRDLLFGGGDVRHLTSVPEPASGIPTYSPAPQPTPKPSEPVPAIAPLEPEQLDSSQAKETNQMTDNPSQNTPEETPTDQPPITRRKRTFPVRFLVREDEKGQVVESRMFYDHEWKDYEAAQQAAEAARKEAEDAAQVAREAELAAGRPCFPNRESDSPGELAVASANSATRSALIAFTRVAHVLSDIPPDYERHSRRCSICSHPDRDAIEGDFVRWRKPAEIIDEYGLTNRYALYRHAHAAGLYQRRQNELARVLEKQLENADDCPLGLFDIITRAVRAYAHLDPNGRWFEPTRTHQILTGRLTPAEAPPRGEVSRDPNLPDPPPTFDVTLNLPHPR